MSSSVGVINGLIRQVFPWGFRKSRIEQQAESGDGSEIEKSGEQSPNYTIGVLAKSLRMNPSRMSSPVQKRNPGLQTFESALHFNIQSNN